VSEPPPRLAGLRARSLGSGRHVAEARGPGTRLRGLARLDELPGEWGLHFPRCRVVHTMGMRFALDLVWLDRHGAVVEIVRDVGPGRHVACRRARSVVELRAGEADAFLAAGLGRDDGMASR